MSRKLAKKERKHKMKKKIISILLVLVFVFVGIFAPLSRVESHAVAVSLGVLAAVISTLGILWTANNVYQLADDFADSGIVEDYSEYMIDKGEFGISFTGELYKAIRSWVLENQGYKADGTTMTIDEAIEYNNTTARFVTLANNRFFYVPYALRNDYVSQNNILLTKEQLDDLGYFAVANTSYFPHYQTKYLDTEDYHGLIKYGREYVYSDSGYIKLNMKFAGYECVTYRNSDGYKWNSNSYFSVHTPLVVMRQNASETPELYLPVVLKEGTANPIVLNFLSGFTWRGNYRGMYLSNGNVYAYDPQTQLTTGKNYVTMRQFVFDVFMENIDTTIAQSIDVADDEVITVPRDKIDTVIDTQTGQWVDDLVDINTKLDAIAESISISNDIIVPDTDVITEFEGFKVPVQALLNKFPFSLPYDLYKTILVFSKPAEVPRFVIPFVLPSINYSTELVIDFTEYESVARIVRWFVLISYIAGLILITRKVMM